LYSAQNNNDPTRQVSEWIGTLYIVQFGQLLGKTKIFAVILRFWGRHTTRRATCITLLTSSLRGTKPVRHIGIWIYFDSAPISNYYFRDQFVLRQDFRGLARRILYLSWRNRALICAVHSASAWPVRYKEYTGQYIYTTHGTPEQADCPSSGLSCRSAFCTLNLPLLLLASSSIAPCTASASTPHWLANPASHLKKILAELLVSILAPRQCYSARIRYTTEC
jgi:hypothetical protein